MFAGGINRNPRAADGNRVLPTIALTVLLALETVNAQADRPPADNDPRTVTLKTGEKVIGTIVKRNDKGVVIDSRGLGAQTIAQADIQSITAGDQDETNLPVVPPGLFGTDVLRGYDRNFRVGVVGTEGSTDSVAANAGFLFKQENAETRTTLEAQYFFAKDNDGVTRNDGFALAERFWYFEQTPRFSVFGRGRYDYNERQSWRNRAAAYAGPAYDFVKNDVFRLTGLLGAGASVTWAQMMDYAGDDVSLELFVGAEGRYQLTAAQELYGHVFYYPSLSDFQNDGRTESVLGYKAKIDRARGLSVYAEGRHEYFLAGPERNEWKYTLGMAIDF